MSVGLDRFYRRSNSKITIRKKQQSTKTFFFTVNLQINVMLYYTSTRREGTILQSPCPSVRSHFRNRYLSFYWKKWFYIWYMALAWWLVPCLPFPGLPHIYFLFTVRLTNERVGVFLARRSVQHLVNLKKY